MYLQAQISAIIIVPNYSPISKDAFKFASSISKLGHLSFTGIRALTNLKVTSYSKTSEDACNNASFLFKPGQFSVTKISALIYLITVCLQDSVFYIKIGAVFHDGPKLVIKYIKSFVSLLYTPDLYTDVKKERLI